jgi:hypothetical protein
MKTLYLEWADPVANSWLTVGKLSENNGKYLFQYSSAAASSQRFTPFGRMTDFNTIYESEELFPLFSNRLLNKSRPEYKSFLSWLDIDDSASPIDILSLSQGTRATDSLRVYSLPEKIGSEYVSKFFIAGMSHVAHEPAERLEQLKKDERLYLMEDTQSAYSNALTLRTEEPKMLVGYCPSFLSAQIKTLLDRDKNCVQVSIQKVNFDAPPPYKILCKLRIAENVAKDIFLQKI